MRVTNLSSPKELSLIQQFDFDGDPSNEETPKGVWEALKRGEPQMRVEGVIVSFS